MKTVFAAILLFIQFGAQAQNGPFTFYTGSSTPGQIEADLLDPAIPVLKPVSKLHFTFINSRELKLVAKSALVLSSVGTVGIITYKLGDEPLREFALKHHYRFTNQISWAAQYFGHSDYMIGAAGLVYATGLSARNPKLQHAGILLVSTLLINDFVTNKLKDEFQRRRPDEANHNYYFEGGEGGRHYASFPSAHTSTAFAFATSVATVYHDHKWVPPVAYAGATLVGLSRIYDNKHWATDVLAGATVGILTAKTTNFLLNQVENQLDKKHVHVYLMPSVSNGTAGLSFGGSF